MDTAGTRSNSILRWLVEIIFRLEQKWKILLEELNGLRYLLWKIFSPAPKLSRNSMVDIE